MYRPSTQIFGIIGLISVEAAILYILKVLWGGSVKSNKSSFWFLFKFDRVVQTHNTVSPNLIMKSIRQPMILPSSSYSLQGCILNLKFIFLTPPPSWFIFLSQMKFYEGVRAACDNFSGFFVLFCKFLVNWGKNMHTFYQLGKKYAFPPPFFHSLSIIFFPQHVIWSYFCPPPPKQ